MMSALSAALSSLLSNLITSARTPASAKGMSPARIIGDFDFAWDNALTVWAKVRSAPLVRWNPEGDPHRLVRMSTSSGWNGYELAIRSR